MRSLTGTAKGFRFVGVGMSLRRGSIVRRSTECPECGATVRWSEQRGLKRFQAKLKRCPECDEVFR